MLGFSLSSALRRGFTLVELLIVIAVIGVLAGGVMTLVNPAGQFQKARDAERKSDLNQIQKAIETYYQDIGSYPVSTSDYKIKKLDSSDGVDWGTSWLPYIASLPADPDSSKKYIYFSTGQAYYIYASLDKEENNISHLPPDASCGSEEEVTACNYGVSSPNVNP